MNKRNVRRRRRRRSRALPCSVFLLAIVAFVMASRMKPAESVGPEPQPSPVQTLTALPVQRGEEPPIPGATAADPAGDDWQLTLVNPWTPLPDGYAPTVTQLKNGHSVDQRCYPDLQEMMDACRAAGNDPLICSSYRSQEKQEALFENKVDRLRAQGCRDPETEAAKVVALPGTSEHQLGLAVDIVDVNNQNLDESQEDTAVQKWLMEHSWEYGFILRYPNDKSEVTGIIYEPWHYRYVGRETAREIYEQGVCLEEYLENLNT